MRPLVLTAALLVLGGPVLSGEKPRVCVTLPAADQEVASGEVTLPGGIVGSMTRAVSADLTDVQRSFLKRKYTVSARCDPQDVRLVVRATMTAISGTAEQGSFSADRRGASGSYSGPGIRVESAYVVDVTLPAPTGPVEHTFICQVDASADRAKRCTKTFEEWLKVQRQLK